MPTAEVNLLFHCCRHWGELHGWRWSDATKLGIRIWNTGNGIV